MSQPRYHINIFWSAADYCWIADVPDLKPCSSHGASPLEAVKEVEIAIDAWLTAAHDNGLSIPEAKYRPFVYGARVP